MSSWADKFEKRLNALTDAASKESIQTLAKWMGFNRKHAEEFAKILATKISSANAARQLVHWQVVHEVLIQEKDGPKWDRLEGLRVTLGEKVVVPLYDKATEGALVGKLKLMLAEWDEVNVFGGPTLINQVRRKMSNSKARKETKTSSETETPSTAKKPETEPARVSVETTAETKDEEATSTAEEKPAPVEKEITKPSSQGKSAKPKLLRRQSTIEEINFDFEAQVSVAARHDSRTPGLDSFCVAVPNLGSPLLCRVYQQAKWKPVSFWNLARQLPLCKLHVICEVTPLCDCLLCCRRSPRKSWKSATSCKS